MDIQLDSSNKKTIWKGKSCAGGCSNITMTGM